MEKEFNESEPVLWLVIAVLIDIQSLTAIMH
jgi:hypothetical protein